MNKRKQVLKFDQEKNLKVIEEELEPKKNSDNKYIPALSFASELGFSISLPIVGGAFLGQYLDNKLNTTPRITLSLVFIGLFLGLTNIYFIIKKNSK